MATYAYLRVSTDRQDAENQKHGILEYANHHDLGKIIYLEDTVSGTKAWRDRKLGELMTETASPGDVVIFAEFSRIGRSTLQVLEVLQLAMESGIGVHIAKDKIVMDDSIQSTIYATVLGLAAEIERAFIAARTKESISRMKSDIETQGYFINAKGEKVTALGRPKGKAGHLKLDAKKEEIKSYIEKEIPKRSIAKLLGCSPSTLYTWIERQGGMKKLMDKTAKKEPMYRLGENEWSGKGRKPQWFDDYVMDGGEAKELLVK